MGNKSTIFIAKGKHHFPPKVSLPVREKNQKNQVHKGREQFWSLLLVAVNIAVTAFITVVVMEVGEDTLGPYKRLECRATHFVGKTGKVRWWFKNLDQVQYILGKVFRYWSSSSSLK